MSPSLAEQQSERAGGGGGPRPSPSPPSPFTEDEETDEDDVFCLGMDVGTRVIRGPDWKWGKQDGGEGFAGTVVEVGRHGSQSSPDKTVVVQWDAGNRTNYRVGYQGSYDLRVLDTAPIGVRHSNISCSSCRSRGIIGMRWKCVTCYDCDLCTRCYMNNKHDLAHNFRRFDSPNAAGEDVGRRKNLTRISIQGIFTGARVERGPDWDWGMQDGGPGKVGRVVDIRGWDNDSEFSVANVVWSSGSTNVYRVGHKGKVDLKLVQPAAGGLYYKDQLPILGTTSCKQLGNIRLRLLNQFILLSLPPQSPVAPSIHAPIFPTGHVSPPRSAHSSVPPSTNSQTPHVAGACGGEATSSHLPSFPFCVGERVKVFLQTDELRVAQEGHGGWNPRMAEYISKVGYVHRVTDKGDIRVTYDDGTRWTYYPGALARVEGFRPGDVVRVSDDPARVREAQDGHGGWIDSMSEALGKVGKIIKLYPDGDLRVQVDGKVWTLNPSNVSLVPGSQLELNNTMATNSREDSNGSTFGSTLAHYLSTTLDLSEPSDSDACSIVERLIRATAKRDVSTLQELLSKAPDLVNSVSKGKTALQLACHQGFLDIVRLLISRGAALDVVDTEGDSPLHYAAFGNQPTVMEYLVLKGSDKDAVNSSRCTPLHVSVNKQHDECVNVLLRAACNVNMQDAYGDTALHDAIGKDNMEIVAELIAVPEVDFTLRNKRGFNVLHHAALKGNNFFEEIRYPRRHFAVTSRKALSVVDFSSAVVRILARSRQCADVKKDDGFTPLHLAALNGHVLVARSLLEQGNCDINIVNNRKQTPLLLAVSQLHFPLVELLVLKGANLSIQDEEGDNVLHVLIPKLPSISRPPDAESPKIFELYVQLQRNLPSLELVEGMAVACFLALHQCPIYAKNRRGRTPLDSLALGPLRDLLVTYYQRGASLIAASTASSGDGPSGGASSLPPSASPPPASCPLPSLPLPECLICCDNGASVTFLPCKHAIVCLDCASRMKKCLKCQSKIEKKLMLDGTVLLDSSPQQKVSPSKSFSLVPVDKLKLLEEKIANLEERHVCSICMERTRNVAFLCGHSACIVCANTLKICHMCRTPIQKTIQLY
ncbi:unnamed protein product [Cyprideis torosa]|uniref:RING-type E3 ubiquitin transferase n=1 Tax=Cyprideis torosa TaxID=163714 RepID=A0A7R8ZIT4_9CRUS|nr:unnamed protein product [Cyprideis torosa]CAG0880694.1 unnamed protein product [Cyprideis torosa]